MLPARRQISWASSESRVFPSSQRFANSACVAGRGSAMQAQFLQRCEEGKTRLSLLAQELCRLAGSILTEYQVLQKKLQGLKNFPQPAREIEEQLAHLLPKNFIAATAFK